LTDRKAYPIIGTVMIYFILGWVTLFAYLPLCWWRHFVEAPSHCDEQTPS
jgi:predicted secreted protein